MTYAIRQLSVSQVEKFDPNQKGGCPRRWWFEGPQGLKPPQTDQQSEGDIGHELLAKWLSTGEKPKGRVKMGKAVTGAIDKGFLPAPGPDLLIERRFSGQPKLDAVGKWIPLNPTLTPIQIGGIPWDGFIDVMHRRDGRVTVIDHKFSSDIHAEWSKRAEDLIHTVQMPVYALVGLSLYPDATEFVLAHHNVSRKGVDSDYRPALVTLDQVREREANIAAVVEQMKVIAPVTEQNDVPYNRKSCSAWMGCPHQTRCTAFKERKVNLTPEEMALFDDLDGVAATTPAPRPPREPGEDDAFGAAPKQAQIPDSKVIPQTTPANDPGLPPPAPGQAKRGMHIIDVPAGHVIAKDCQQGAQYIVNGQPATFIANTAVAGQSYSSFTPVTGGAPLLIGVDTPVAPVPVEKKPAPEPQAAQAEPKRRTTKKTEEKPAPVVPETAPTPAPTPAPVASPVSVAAPTAVAVQPTTGNTTTFAVAPAVAPLGVQFTLRVELGPETLAYLRALVGAR